MSARGPLKAQQGVSVEFWGLYGRHGPHPLGPLRPLPVGIRVPEGGGE